MAFAVLYVTLALCKYVVYLLCRGLFHTVQRLLWRLTPIHAEKLHLESGSDDRYAVHVLNIVGRRKMDFLNSASEQDFVTTHHGFEGVQRVLEKNVSLYAITETDAIFVETPPGVDIYSSDATSFFDMAQFENATKLLKVKHSTFHKAASKMGPISETVVILANTGRCGSTLLARMFEATGQVLSLCEPAAFVHLADELNAVPSQQRIDLLKSSIRVLCKHVKPGIKYFLIKPRLHSNKLVPTMVREMPYVKVLFMYRQGLESVRSFESMLRHTLLRYVGECIMACPGYDIRSFLWSKVFDETGSMLAEGRTRAEVCFILVSVTYKEYLQWRQDGVHIPAVRYEHLVDNPQMALATIFHHCGIPEELVVKGITAINVDSQVNSPFAKKRLGSKMTYTPEVRVFCDERCDRMGIPRLDDPSDLPGTITGK